MSYQIRDDRGIWIETVPGATMLDVVFRAAQMIREDIKKHHRYPLTEEYLEGVDSVLQVAEDTSDENGGEYLVHFDVYSPAHVTWKPWTVCVNVYKTGEVLGLLRFSDGSNVFYLDVITQAPQGR